MLADTSPASAKYADGMCLVHHQDRIIALLYFDNAWQIGYIAILAVHALNDYEYTFEVVTMLIQ